MELRKYRIKGSADFSWLWEGLSLNQQLIAGIYLFLGWNQKSIARYFKISKGGIRYRLTRIRKETQVHYLLDMLNKRKKTMGVNVDFLQHKQ